MKNKETDFDEEVFASNEAFNKRFRRIEGNELIEHKRRIAKALGKNKNRVTIYFDSDIVQSFKARGEREGVGYQTLMNDALRKFIENEASSDIKEDILTDKKFLKRLKAALAG